MSELTEILDAKNIDIQESQEYLTSLQQHPSSVTSTAKIFRFDNLSNVKKSFDKTIKNYVICLNENSSAQHSQMIIECADSSFSKEIFQDGHPAFLILQICITKLYLDLQFRVSVYKEEPQNVHLKIHPLKMQLTNDENQNITVPSQYLIKGQWVNLAIDVRSFYPKYQDSDFQLQKIVMGSQAKLKSVLFSNSEIDILALNRDELINNPLKQSTTMCSPYITQILSLPKIENMIQDLSQIPNSLLTQPNPVCFPGNSGINNTSPQVPQSFQRYTQDDIISQESQINFVHQKGATNSNYLNNQKGFYDQRSQSPYMEIRNFSSYKNCGYQSTHVNQQQPGSSIGNASVQNNNANMYGNNEESKQSGVGINQSTHTRNRKRTSASENQKLNQSQNNNLRGTGATPNSTIAPETRESAARVVHNLGDSYSNNPHHLIINQLSSHVLLQKYHNSNQNISVLGENAKDVNGAAVGGSGGGDWLSYGVNSGGIGSSTNGLVPGQIHSNINSQAIPNNNQLNLLAENMNWIQSQLGIQHMISTMNSVVKENTPLYYQQYVSGNTFSSLEFNPSKNNTAYNILTTQTDYCPQTTTENVNIILNSLNNTSTTNTTATQVVLPQNTNVQVEKCIFPKIMSKEKSMRKVNNSQLNSTANSSIASRGRNVTNYHPSSNQQTINQASSLQNQTSNATTFTQSNNNLNANNTGIYNALPATANCSNAQGSIGASNLESQTQGQARDRRFLTISIKSLSPLANALNKYNQENENYQRMNVNENQIVENASSQQQNIQQQAQKSRTAALNQRKQVFHQNSSISPSPPQQSYTFHQQTGPSNSILEKQSPRESKECQLDVIHQQVQKISTNHSNNHFSHNYNYNGIAASRSNNNNSNSLNINNDLTTNISRNTNNIASSNLQTSKAQGQQVSDGLHTERQFNEQKQHSVLSSNNSTSTTATMGQDIMNIPISQSNIKYSGNVRNPNYINNNQNKQRENTQYHPQSQFHHHIPTSVELGAAKMQQFSMGFNDPTVFTNGISNHRWNPGFTSNQDIFNQNLHREYKNCASSVSYQIGGAEEGDEDLGEVNEVITCDNDGARRPEDAVKMKPNCVGGEEIQQQIDVMENQSFSTRSKSENGIISGSGIHDSRKNDSVQNLREKLIQMTLKDGTDETVLRKKNYFQSNSLQQKFCNDDTNNENDPNGTEDRAGCDQYDEEVFEQEQDTEGNAQNNENEKAGDQDEEGNCVSEVDGSSLVESVNQPSERGEDEDLESDLAVSMVVGEQEINKGNVPLSGEEHQNLVDSRERKQKMVNIKLKNNDIDIKSFINKKSRRFEPKRVGETNENNNLCNQEKDPAKIDLKEECNKRLISDINTNELQLTQSIQLEEEKPITVAIIPIKNLVEAV